MLRSGKYDFVHDYFGKMKRSGEAPKALTYKGGFSCPFPSIGFGVWCLTSLLSDFQFLLELFGRKVELMKLSKQSGIWNKGEWLEQLVYIMSWLAAFATMGGGKMLF